MAGAGWRRFQPGEVLTASNLQTYGIDQSVQVYAGTAARGSAIGTAVSEGMVSYLNDADRIEVYNGSAWKQIARTTGSVIQVLSSGKVDTFTTASRTFVDITGMTVDITPTSATNKILVIVDVYVGVSTAGAYPQISLFRDSTQIAQGISTTDRERSSIGMTNQTSYDWQAAGVRQSIVWFDEPATTSSLTYKLQGACRNAGTMYLNRSGTDPNSSNSIRSASSITVIEVVA